MSGSLQSMAEPCIPMPAVCAPPDNARPEPGATEKGSFYFFKEK